MEKVGTDLVTQVAEAKCCWGCTANSDTNGLCGDCQNTGLRWPTLSRECCRQHPPNVGTYPCSNPNCSGRVPDVTLEKVLEAFPSNTHVLMYRVDAGWCCELDIVIPGMSGPIMEYGDTPLEAACAALLAT